MENLEEIKERVIICQGQFQKDYRGEGYCTLIPISCEEKSCPYQNTGILHVPQKKHNECCYQIPKFKCNFGKQV